MKFAARLDNVETSAIREIFKMLGKPGLISLAGGFPDSALFDVYGLREASAKVLADQPGSALQYGATEGFDPLRRELSMFMKAKGASVSYDDLIVTTGSQQALDLIGKTLISPGDKVIVEGPTFLSTIQCFRLYGAELITAPVDENGIKTDDLEKLIHQHNPKFIYLIPTFGNPTGALLNLQRRREILEIATRCKTLIVEDDPYGDLYFEQQPPPSILALTDQVRGSKELVVYCGSLSKILSPGLRIGWMTGPKELLAKAVMCKQFSDAHTSTFAQATAAQYLADGRLPSLLTTLRQTYSQRALSMDEALKRELGDAVTYTRPKGGLFFWVRLTGIRGMESDANILAKRAIDELVAFVPGAPFYANKPDISTMRLSFATASVEQIHEAITRMRRALISTKRVSSFSI